MLKIKPGILVALRTKVAGGVVYERIDLSRHVEGNREDATWKTTRHITDVEENQKACDVRSEARRCIARCCVKTPWGLVCIDEKEQELLGAIAKAHETIGAFNSEAKHTSVRLSVMMGRVAKDDIEATLAIRDEVAALLQQAEAAMHAGSVRDMRDAAKRARQLNKLVDDDEASQSLSAAIKAVRKLARDVVKLVEKKGEDLESVLAEEHLRPVSAARFRFAPSTQPAAGKVSE